jgi:hypothetical protein
MSNTENVYHIIQMHSDNASIIQYTNTKSSCPINAIKVLIKQWKNMSHFACFTEIPEVKLYMDENSIEACDVYEVLTETHASRIEELILSYCITKERALSLIDLINKYGTPDSFDPVFIELAGANNSFMKYINHMCYHSESSNGSDSEPESEEDS